MNPEEEIGQLVADGAVRSFGPGFTNRVMARLDRSPVVAVRAGLERYFLRLAPVALALAAILAAINLRHAGRGQKPIDAALGLPAATIAAAYDLDGSP